MARVSPSLPPVTDAAPPRVARDRSTVGLLLISLRPEQWTKNLLVLAGVVFGGRLMDPAADEIALGAFAIFCALSGAVYLFNDIADRALHLDDQQRASAGMPSDDVDGAAFPVDGERHLRMDDPIGRR